MMRLVSVAIALLSAAVCQGGEWNRYRVECKGKSIKTWINGVPCADFEGDMTARGVIGLQVHGVPKDRFEPYQVRWRNLRIMELD